jgi:Amt family ammonium transporter
MHPTIGQVLPPTILLPPMPQTGEIQVTPSSNFNLVVLKLITFPTGHENLNKWFQSGDQAYIIVASAMVLVMVPGLGFLYSGLARRKSALSMMWACMGAGSVVTFQWYLWGYSLAFSPTGQSGFIGDLKRFGLLNTLANPSPGSPLIPSLLYAFYQVSVSTVGASWPVC